MRLILARHGQSFGNIDPSAWPDPVLTPLGEQQADRLGRWLQTNRPEIDLILCSPLKRARMTAEIVNQYLNLPLQVNDDLAEINQFDLPLLPRRTNPFEPGSIHYPPETNGYYEAYCTQVKRALAYITADLVRPKPLLVVSHGGTSATILRLILERHDIFFWTRNTGMHFLQWDDGRWSIEGLNFTSHLPPELIS
jgi:broad specificity phosphatase PhoE